MFNVFCFKKQVQPRKYLIFFLENIEKIQKTLNLDNKNSFQRTPRACFSDGVKKYVEGAKH